jgi:hypothetical protein
MPNYPNIWLQLYNQLTRQQTKAIQQKSGYVQVTSKSSFTKHYIAHKSNLRKNGIDTIVGYSYIIN